MPDQAVEAERRLAEAVRAARAEAEARADETLRWGVDAAGLDAGGRRLLRQSKAAAAELALHVAVRRVSRRRVLDFRGFRVLGFRVPGSRIRSAGWATAAKLALHVAVRGVCGFPAP